MSVTLDRTGRAPDTVTEEVRACSKALTLLNGTKWLSSFQQQKFKVDLDQCDKNKKGYMKTNLWSSESGPLNQLDETVSKCL